MMGLREKLSSLESLDFALAKKGFVHSIKHDIQANQNRRNMATIKSCMELHVSVERIEVM
jgi:hypothetical protein